MLAGTQSSAKRHGKTNSRIFGSKFKSPGTDPGAPIDGLVTQKVTPQR